MAMTVHLFGTQEGRNVVAHCGLTGARIMTTKFLHAVTCKECRRPGPGRGRRRPLVPPVPADYETVDK